MLSPLMVVVELVVTLIDEGTSTDGVSACAQASIGAIGIRRKIPTGNNPANGGMREQRRAWFFM
jgi:hypothetical protein